MSRLLSQQEVDALLAEFAETPSGAEAAFETPFDLRAPLVLAGERLALVQAACEKLAQAIAESLTLLLVAEKPVNAEFTGLVQQPASTVLGTLAPGEPLATLLDEHQEVVGGLSLQTELALALVDRLQGGEGSAAGGPRALSPVELRLLEAALVRLVRHLDRNTPLRPLSGSRLEPEPLFGRLAGRGGVLVTAMLRLSTAGGTAIARLLLTPVLINRLAAQVEIKAVSSTPDELLAALAAVPVAVEPVVEGGSVRAFDLLRLRPGRVLQLDRRESDRWGLRINGALMARGQVVRNADQRLFRVEELS